MAISAEVGPYFLVTATCDNMLNGYVDKTQVAVDSGSLKSYAIGTCCVARTYVYNGCNLSDVKLLTLGKGNKVSIISGRLCGPYDTFYKAKAGSVTGYVLADHLTIDKPPTPTSNIVFAKGTAIADTDVNKYPSTSGTCWLQLHPGDTVTIISVTPSFYKVLARNYIVGYTPKKNVSITGGDVSRAAPKKKSIFSTGKAKTSCSIYKSLSNSSTVLKSLDPGKTFTVISVSGSFFKVKSGTITGYIPTQYVKVLTGKTICAVGEAKNQCIIYASTSTSSTVKLTLETYSLVALQSVTGSFYKVTVSGVTGYILNEDIKVL